MFPVIFNNQAARGGDIPWYQKGVLSSLTWKAIYQPKGAASLAASYVNLATPGTLDAHPGNAPAWDATNGWKFDGILHVLHTGVIPGNGWTIAIRFSNAGASDYPIIGCSTGTLPSAVNIFANHSSNTRYYDYGSELNNGTGAASGVIILCNTKAYLNGVDEGIALDGTTTNVTQDLYVGGTNSNGAAAVSPVYVQAVAIDDTALTAPQIALLYAQMAAL